MKTRIWPATLLFLATLGCNSTDDGSAGDPSADQTTGDPSDDQPTANLSDQLNAEMAESANTAVLIGSAQSFVSGHGVDPDGGDGSAPKAP